MALIFHIKYLRLLKCGRKYFQFIDKKEVQIKEVLENELEVLLKMDNEIGISWKIIHSETNYIFNQRINIMYRNGTVFDDGYFDEKILHCTVMEIYWKNFKVHILTTSILAFIVTSGYLYNKFVE